MTAPSQACCEGGSSYAGGGHLTWVIRTTRLTGRQKESPASGRGCRDEPLVSSAQVQGDSSNNPHNLSASDTLPLLRSLSKC